jgi:hypothetical protein
MEVRGVSLPLAVFALVLVSSCGGEGPQHLVQVRDSAGVAIVQNPGSQASVAIWRVSTEPVLTIGLREGPDEFLLDRVAAAFQLSDGRIVVANGGTAELRFFDADGSFLYATGGRGEGPGELRVLYRMTRLDGDTLVASDLAVGRLDWFDGQGQFIRRERLNVRGLVEPPYFNEGAHLLPDRTVLMRAYEMGDLSEGLHRTKLGFLRYDPATERLDTLGWFAALENFVIEIGSRPVALVAPFARHSVQAWSDRTIYLADTDRNEVHAIDMATGGLRLIRRDMRGPAVTAHDRRRFVERYREYMERSPRPTGDVERWLAAVPYPDTKPPIGSLTADRSDHLWVEQTPADPDGPVTWAVFDRQGELKAEVDLPNGFAPMDIGEDYVLGRWRDEDGVEFVRYYSLDRG